ncbi:hypothetical protein NEFER03_0971 [Nematocida sp. LUAm3]|nr:hypothetical protein NEFER03_0971 [Nematocida sp. LUAm3]KAI5175425.1 hypothetical protein NEFER02_1354 [Nematocida sp. LUAm2]KAI5177618.1 hypothetical protein NEFER01_0842 [Nematocida sp. LUAm1]
MPNIQTQKIKIPKKDILVLLYILSLFTLASSSEKVQRARDALSTLKTLFVVYAMDAPRTTHLDPSVPENQNGSTVEDETMHTNRHLSSFWNIDIENILHKQASSQTDNPPLHSFEKNAETSQSSPHNPDMSTDITPTSTNMDWLNSELDSSERRVGLAEKNGKLQIYFGDSCLSMKHLDIPLDMWEALNQSLQCISQIECEQLRIDDVDCPSISILLTLATKATASIISIVLNIDDDKIEVDNYGLYVQSLLEISDVPRSSPILSLTLNISTAALMDIFILAISHRELMHIKIDMPLLTSLDFLGKIRASHYLQIELNEVIIEPSTLLKFPILDKQTTKIRLIILFNSMQQHINNTQIIDAASLHAFLKHHTFVSLSLDQIVWQTIREYCAEQKIEEILDLSAEEGFSEIEVINVLYVPNEEASNLSAPLPWIRVKRVQVYLNQFNACGVPKDVYTKYLDYILLDCGIACEEKKITYHSRNDMQWTIAFLTSLKCFEYNPNSNISCFQNEQWVSLGPLNMKLNLAEIKNISLVKKAFHVYRRNVSSLLCQCFTYKEFVVDFTVRSHITLEHAILIEKQFFTFLNMQGNIKAESCHFTNVSTPSNPEYQMPTDSYRKFTLEASSIVYTNPSIEFLHYMLTRYIYKIDTQVSIIGLDHFCPEVFDLFLQPNNEKIKTLIFVSPIKHSYKFESNKFAQLSQERWAFLRAQCTRYPTIAQITEICDRKESNVRWECNFLVLCDLASMEEVRKMPLEIIRSLRNNHMPQNEYVKCITITFMKNLSLTISQHDLQLLFKWIYVYFPLVRNIDVTYPLIEQNTYMHLRDCHIQLPKFKNLKKVDIYHFIIKKKNIEEIYMWTGEQKVNIPIYSSFLVSTSTIEHNWFFLECSLEEKGVLISKRLARRLSKISQEILLGSNTQPIQETRKSFLKFLSFFDDNRQREALHCLICQSLDNNQDEEYDFLVLPCGHYSHYFCALQYYHTSMQDSEDEDIQLNEKLCLTKCKTNPYPISFAMVVGPDVHDLDVLSDTDVVNSIKIRMPKNVLMWGENVLLNNIYYLLHKKHSIAEHLPLDLSLKTLEMSSTSSDK